MKFKLILVLIFLFGIQSALACRCVKNISVKTEFKETEVIVSGKVLSKTYVSSENVLEKERLDLIKKEYKDNPKKMSELKMESIIKIELGVNYTYKGNAIQDKITIYTSKFSSACGYLGFEVGQDFITYLSTRDNGYFWTNRCTRTKKFDEMDDKTLCELMSVKKY